MSEKTLTLAKHVSISTKFHDYMELTKVRLSSLVVFSAAMGYVIGSGSDFSWTSLLLLSLGGFLVTGSSNGFNQVIEKDFDKLMDRTANRPVPAGRLSVMEATAFSFLMGVGGILILWIGLNALCAILSLFSLLVYVLLYTPSKRITPFSVLIGAIPGAFPPLLGWIAARNSIGMEAIVLYAIQFIWQFPHFWAIAWLLHDDYSKAGFKMLPAGGRTKFTAFQTMVYTLCLIPMGLLPQFFGLTGTFSTILMVVCGIIFTVPAIRLYSSCELKSAQKLMFGSFIYLPTVQIVWMLSKVF